MKRALICWAALLGVAVAGSTADARGWFRRAKKDCDCADSHVVATPTAYKTEERTVMVPEWTTETRDVWVTEYKTESTTRKVKVLSCKPVTEDKTITYTVWESKKVRKTQTTYECEKVTEPQKQTYCEYERTTVCRKGTRKVCKMVNAVEERTCTKDLGHWVRYCEPCVVKKRKTLRERLAELCGRKECCDEPQYVVKMVRKKKWVPNVVTTVHKVNVCKPTWVEEPYEWTETVCKPIWKERTIDVTRWVYKPKSREVEVIECVPVKKTKTCKVTTYKTVEEWVERPYVKCTAHKVKKQETVKVCKMVAKKIKVKVPVGDPCR